MPEIDFATEKEIFTTTAPEHNFAQPHPGRRRRGGRQHQQRPPSPRGDQTTSADEETDHRQPEVRRQQRAPPLHDNTGSDETEPRPRKFRKTSPDARTVPSCTDWTSPKDIIDQFDHFHFPISDNSYFNSQQALMAFNFFGTGSNPSLATDLFSSIASLSFELVRSLEKETVQATVFS